VPGSNLTCKSASDSKSEFKVIKRYFYGHGNMDMSKDIDMDMNMNMNMNMNTDKGLTMNMSMNMNIDMNILGGAMNCGLLLASPLRLGVHEL
jgi:hypothetical protein